MESIDRYRGCPARPGLPDEPLRHLSATGERFDIGMTVRAALNRFLTTQDPIAGSTDARSAGNGSLMRLAPVAMWFAPDLAAARQHARSSATTLSPTFLA
jgi:ADP-ribosyl-[dinitrogen reductase] hydrolase